jgi:predicted glutamine amidotransferase
MNVIVILSGIWIGSATLNANPDLIPEPGTNTPSETLVLSPENCRLFGAVSESFDDMARIAVLLDRFSHPSLEQDSGWSLSCYSDFSLKGVLSIPGYPMVIRSHVPIIDDAAMFLACTELITRMEPQVILGHLRSSTSGCAFTADPHPFVRKLNGKWYAFSHNGAVWDADLATLISLVGSWGEPENCPGIPIDSEYLFLYLLKTIDESVYDELDAITESVSTLRGAFGEDWNAINFTLTDGYTLWGVRCRREDDRFRLHYHALDLEHSGYVIATDRLSPNAILMNNHSVIELKPHMLPQTRSLSKSFRTGGSK